MHTTKKHQEHKPTATVTNTTLKSERNKRTRNQTTYHKQEKIYFSSKHMEIDIKTQKNETTLTLY